jgi:Skp family chaperone for outer membrane proteins
MIRWSVLITGAVVVAGAAFVAGSAVPTAAPAGPVKVVADAAKPEPVRTVVINQKTGYFNLPKVMKEFRKAKTQVEQLTDKRNRMSADLVKMRERYIQLQADARKATGDAEKEKIAEELLSLARKIEDADRKINRELNDRASAIIGELYDELYAVVKDVARENGLVAVIAYPDAVTPEDAANPFIKELKLKPPAAQPFYLDPSVDYTDAIIRKLNAKAE